MGRRTFDSIGKPLAGRTNIVVSRDPDFFRIGIKIARCFNEAISIAREEMPEHEISEEEVFVIGGEQIFEMALADADRIYLTEILTRVEGGDAFFPEFDERQWRIAKEVQLAEASDVAPAARFKVLDRVPA
jgi:dihydrofolate reductase